MFLFWGYGLFLYEWKHCGHVCRVQAELKRSNKNLAIMSGHSKISRSACPYPNEVSH